MRFKRLITLFEIFLAVSISFVLGFNFSSANVYAQEDDDRVCCVQAEIDGETKACQYTDESNCVGGRGISTRCEDTLECRPVCCDLTVADYEETGGLGCLQNVAASTCSAREGNVADDASCRSAPQCSTGCCIVGTQGVLTTEAGCNSLTSRYPDLTMDFRADIQNEIGCFLAARTQEKGCCVGESADAENSCGLSTRGECSGEFFANTDCVDVPDGKCENCNPEIPKSEWKKTCSYDYGDSVFYEDACGNPIVFGAPAKPCVYSDGFLCREEDNNVYCDDLNCAADSNPETSEIWDNPRVDENGDCSSGAAFNDNCWTNDYTFNGRNSRRNGEKWCEFDADAGPTRDLPGTRHYVHACYEGKETVIPCEEYRNEYCFQFDGPEISSAGCFENKASINRCGECTARDCCENSDLRTCVWVSADQERVDESVQDINDARRERAEARGEDLPADVASPDADEDGLCFPLVPPGTIGNPELCGFNNGEEFVNPLNLEVAWHNAGSWADWDCDGPCKAYTQKFAYQYNSLCNAQGDCGAGYNLIGKWSEGGFERTCDVGSEIRNDFGDGDVSGVGADGEYNYWYQGNVYDEDDADRLINNCLTQLPDPADKTDGDFNFLNYLTYKGGLNAELPPEAADLGFWAEGVIGERVSGAELVAILGTVGMMAIVNVAGFFTGATVGIALIAAPIPIINIVVLSLVVIASVVILLTGGESTEDVHISCNPWVPPNGGENCELCHQAGTINAEGQAINVDFTAGGLHDCTLALCWSLGQGCEFFSNVEEGPRCLSKCEGENADVNFNRYQITDLDLSEDNKNKCTLTQDYTSEERDCIQVNGQLGFVKANTAVKVGVHTDELATCRWDFERPSGPTDDDYYNNLKNTFDQSLASNDHTIILEPSIHLNAGDRKTMYVACIDVCENTNAPNYYDLNIEVGNVQDVGAPRFMEIIPESGSAIKHDLEEFTAKLKLEEPAMCRWSRTNDVYELMPEENPINCRTGYNRNGCNIQFTNLVQGVNKFYIRCQDEQGNSNVDSIPSNEGYVLFRSNPLEIVSVRCIHSFGDECGTIYDKNFTLEAATFGGGYEGKAVCYLRMFGDSETPFRYTNSSLHTQVVGPRLSGTYNDVLRCVDNAGNDVVQNINYTFFVDDDAPKILRVNKEGDNLVILTDEDATCRYADNKNINYNEMNEFGTSGGMRHSTSISRDYMSVICMDRFNHFASLDVYSAEL